MDWNFSIEWFMGGVAILVAGAAIVANYRRISDTWLSGVASYERCKLVGVITMIVGLLIMANLHTLVLTGLVNLVFKR